MGLYALLSIFYLFLVQRQIDIGPEAGVAAAIRQD